jgi:23S rRNA (uracil1939-C5)-methyltransferase
MRVKLEKFVPGGQALGNLPDGKKVFVWGGLPGEEVEVAITKSKKTYAEGLVEKVLSSSPHRIEPQDACYLSTSPWQTVAYDYELEQKSALIKEAFEQHGVSLSQAPLTTDGREYFYRNKMEYALYWDKAGEFINLAFHQRGSHTKLPIVSSSLEQPEILAEAQNIVAQLNARGEPARKYQSLVVRANQQGEVSSALFENRQPHPTMKNLSDQLLGHDFSYSPNGFFQVNLPVYELALQKIQQSISPNQPIVDIYAGVGTIGLSVCGDDQPLTLIETNRKAFIELEHNCAGLNYAQAVLSDAENALKYITYDINLIVDPPRAGLADSVVARILETLPQKVIYLSCNPITQARDIAKLTTKYAITDCVGYNFFPHTPHIENLVVLERL